MIKKMASVKSTSSNKMYVLSLDPVTFQWQCSCPGWTRRMPRIECRHIMAAKLRSSDVVWTEEGKKWVNKQQVQNVTPPEAIQDRTFMSALDKKKSVSKPSKKPVKPKIEYATSSRFANLEWDDEE